MSDLGLMPPPLRDLRDVGGRLATALSASATRLREQSEVPAEELLEELREFSRRFVEVRQQLHSGDPAPASVRELELAWQSRQQTRRALNVLDRLETIRHVEVRDLASLQAARQLAWDLRGELNSGDRDRVQQRTAELLRDDHPLQAVITLVTDDTRLDDHTWNLLHETVTQAFGKELATAIVRRKLKC